MYSGSIEALFKNVDFDDFDAAAAAYMAAFHAKEAERAQVHKAKIAQKPAEKQYSSFFDFLANHNPDGSSFSDCLFAAMLKVTSLGDARKFADMLAGETK